MPEISDEELARYKRSIAEAVEKLRDMSAEIKRQDEQIAANGRREDGWKKRVEGLEAELTRRGWPHHEGFESMQAEIDRQRGEIERLEVAVGDTAELVRKANEARDLRRKVGELEKRIEEMNRHGTRQSDTIREQAATILNLQNRLRVAERLGGNPFGRSGPRPGGAFRAGFFGVDWADPPKDEAALKLPEGLELTDLLKLVHPDRHQGANNDKANAVTRWLLDEKRKKEEQGR